MTSLTSKEFFDLLKADNFKPCFSLKGIVKKSEKDTDVLFAGNGDFSKWISVPSTMVESVNVLESFTKGETTFTVVKIQLKKPSTPEGQVYYELLSLMGKEEMKEEKFGCESHNQGCSCHQSGCGCHQSGCSCHTDHHCGCMQGHH